MNFVIDYKIISDAIQFYEDKGYKYINVDWSVSEETISITKPEKAGQQIKIDDEILVASAEQSFLQKIIDSELPVGKYVACTPCFRLGELDNLHHPYFMKVELIDYTGLIKNESNLYYMINQAKIFFSEYLNNLSILIDNEIIDLVYKNIELGSYAIRYHKDIGYWIYGTGCAEPRLSYCRNLK